MFRVKSPQDLGAAVFFMLFGLAGVYFASDLAQGTAQRMGPGYFPTLLGWLIFGIGAILKDAQGERVDEPRVPIVQLRARGLIAACDSRERLLIRLATLQRRR